MKTWIQAGLFDEPPVNDKFTKYHAENPAIYAAFERLALEQIQRGRKHIGSKALMEVIRFQTPVTAMGDVFKINNSFTSAYVRLFIKDYPEYADRFELRKSRYDDVCETT